MIHTTRWMLAAAVAAFALLALPVSAPAQYYVPPQSQFTQTYPDYVTGRIGVSRPYNVWLGTEAGLHITLHDGTIIMPTGTTLESGMRIRIYGTWNSDGSFDANQIEVLPATQTSTTTYGNMLGAYGPGRYPEDTSLYQGYMSGTVSSFQPYNLFLGRTGNANDRRHITLHDGTVINPTGITLQAGMNVHIWGSWNSNGTFDANQIDVLNPGQFGS